MISVGKKYEDKELKIIKSRNNSQFRYTRGLEND